MGGRGQVQQLLIPGKGELGFKLGATVEASGFDSVSQARAAILSVYHGRRINPKLRRAVNRLPGEARGLLLRQGLQYGQRLQQKVQSEIELPSGYSDVHGFEVATNIEVPKLRGVKKVKRKILAVATDEKGNPLVAKSPIKPKEFEKNVVQGLSPFYEVETDEEEGVRLSAAMRRKRERIRKRNDQILKHNELVKSGKKKGRTRELIPMPRLSEGMRHSRVIDKKTGAPVVEYEYLSAAEEEEAKQHMLSRSSREMEQSPEFRKWWKEKTGSVRVSGKTPAEKKRRKKIPVTKAPKDTSEEQIPLSGDRLQLARLANVALKTYYVLRREEPSPEYPFGRMVRVKVVKEEGKFRTPTPRNVKKVSVAKKKKSTRKRRKKRS